MTENEIKIGQTVYFKENWSGVIQEAKVIDILLMEDQKRYPGKKYAKLKCDIGTCGSLLEALYPSFKACEDACLKHSQIKLQNIKQKLRQFRI